MHKTEGRGPALTDHGLPVPAPAQGPEQVRDGMPAIQLLRTVRRPEEDEGWGKLTKELEKKNGKELEEIEKLKKEIQGLKRSRN